MNNPSYLSDLIYPYTKPNEYYNQIQKNPKKGKLYNYKNIYFTEFENLSDESLTKFKKCCLCQKQLLFENGSIQIGTVTSTQTLDSDTYIRLSIFIGNMKDAAFQSFNIQYFFLKDLTISLKEHASRILPPKSQIKQELIINYNTIPYQILFNKLQYECGFAVHEVSFPMPITFNKFLKVRYLETEEFVKEWKKNKENCMSSNLYYVDENLIKNNIYDFKMYFNNLIDLKPWNLFNI